MITGLKSIFYNIINKLPTIFSPRELKPNELTLKLKKEENGIKPELIKFTSHLEDELPSESFIEQPSFIKASIESDTDHEMIEGFLPFSKCRNVSVNSLSSYQSEQEDSGFIEEKYIDVDKDPAISNSEKVIFKEDQQKPFNHKTLAKTLLCLGIATLGLALVAGMSIILFAISAVFVSLSLIALCAERKPTANVENIDTCEKPLSLGSKIEICKLTCSENSITSPGI